MASEDSKSEDKNTKVEVEVSLFLQGLRATLKCQVPIGESKAVMTQFFSDIQHNAEQVKSILEKISPMQKTRVNQEVTLSEKQEKINNFSNGANSSEEPMVNIANDLAISFDQLKSAKIFGFKPGNEKPQLIGYNKFKPEGGALAILYAYEIGLGKSFVPYDEVNEVFQQCPYKVGNLSERVVHNLKNGNKVDKKRYENSKELTLTPSGLESARKQIKEALGASN